MQPVKLLLPVTEYTVNVIGETVTLELTTLLLHVYVSAPFANNVTELPEHTAVFPEIATVGLALTAIEIVLVALQLLVDVPITEYTVFTVGDSIMLAALELVFHV